MDVRRSAYPDTSSARALPPLMVRSCRDVMRWTSDSATLVLCIQAHAKPTSASLIETHLNMMPIHGPLAIGQIGNAMSKDTIEGPSAYELADLI